MASQKVHNDLDLQGANRVLGSKVSVNKQTGATYTLVAGDCGKVVDLTNALATITVTLPNSLPEGFHCLIVQSGTFQVTLSPASGATLRNRQSHTKTNGQWSVVSLFVRGNSGGAAAEYVMQGDSTS